MWRRCHICVCLNWITHKKIMGVNNFSFWILLTRPQRHELSEFQPPGALTPLTTTWVQCAHCHFTPTITSGQCDPNSWRTRSLAKSRRARMTASAPIYKSHKKMKLLKSWKRADARLHSFTWVNSLDPGHPYTR